jgi:gamma-glutamyl hercynylcysteine S-oxide synthase
MKVCLWITGILILLFFTNEPSCSQDLKDVQWNGTGIRVIAFQTSDGTRIPVQESLPLFTFHVRDRLVSSEQAKVTPEGNATKLTFTEGLVVQLKRDTTFRNGWKSTVNFYNSSADTLEVYNVVPFGETNKRVYLTAAGPMDLARAKIFRPGLGAIDVVLPDNCWSMGYGEYPLTDSLAICALARRTGDDSCIRKRYSTVLPPKSSVKYTFYLESYKGIWQDGLKRMFRDRYLYDLEDFDNTLYRRKDLQWIRHAYVMSLQAAWDKQFYDLRSRKYTVFQFLAEGERLFGGYDVYGLWPNFPRLGLDHRNQFDMYRELPFGLEKLKEIVSFAHHNGTNFFISYNPWDKDTRPEDHTEGLVKIISGIGADGVVLDTQASSSHEFQAAVDTVKSGVIMYSEGMAVPKDMPGIVSGRVHDAIFYQPPLNLNKLIKPEFAIFRVCQLSQGRIHRETAISFFNGYGTEINTFAPGRPSWAEEEFLFLGRTTKILRENSDAFLDHDWIPLINSLHDSIWINHWQDGKKQIYTVFSLVPSGFDGPLFEADSGISGHWVSLWNHEEVVPSMRGNKIYIPVSINAFNESWLKTRREGNLDCIALLPELIRARIDDDSLFLRIPRGMKLKLWKGNPSYQDRASESAIDSIGFCISEKYPSYEGKIVAELFDGMKLVDEKIIQLGEARIKFISHQEKTTASPALSGNMMEIKAGSYQFVTETSDDFVPYPLHASPTVVKLKRYFMDRYPVTNKDFMAFMLATSYKPVDPSNFLKHWENGNIPQGQEDYPVVYISLEDAKAYAKWAGKRLPSEVEWQYAAQGMDGRKYPWGNDFHGTKCNNAFGQPTPVDAFPKGKSPFGVEDMIGNVWQLTNDEYDNGSYSFIIIKGGSFYKPTSSMWYLPGGVQPIIHRQMLLRISQGLDRSETVGFRCVMDAKSED